MLNTKFMNDPDAAMGPRLPVSVNAQARPEHRARALVPGRGLLYGNASHLRGVRNRVHGAVLQLSVKNLAHHHLHAPETAG